MRLFFEQLAEPENIAINLFHMEEFLIFERKESTNL